MDALVGYTGFVGSNLLESHKFDKLYNSKNIREAYGLNPDLLVYAGIRAEMFLANQDPEADLRIINDAFDNIKIINPKKIVLISTVAVYGDDATGDEDKVIDKNKLKPYGINRLKLEEMVEKEYTDYLIVRLPAIYGKNLKKNFIYDMINIVPKLLKYEKYNELLNKNNKLSEYYERQDNGFYRCKDLNVNEKEKLKEMMKEISFTAINFTDSRSIYQFYNLNNLWNHINIALNNNIRKINLVTEPINTAELYKEIFNECFYNEISILPFNYNLKTKHFEKLNGKNGYVFDKNTIIKNIKLFIKENK